MAETRYTAEKTTSSARPLRFDETLCVGCNRCVDACQIDVMLPNPEKGRPPLVMWPGECWYCGACVMECLRKGAITLRHSLMNQARFVEKDTVEDDAASQGKNDVT